MTKTQYTLTASTEDMTSTPFQVTTDTLDPNAAGLEFGLKHFAVGVATRELGANDGLVTLAAYDELSDQWNGIGRWTWSGAKREITEWIVTSAGSRGGFTAFED